MDDQEDRVEDGAAPAASLPTEGIGEGVLVPGATLARRYQVRRLLGRGGMGEVWQAFDLRLRVEVALKALRSDLFGDERALELVGREVRAAREVVSPNVCRVFDLIEVDGLELVSMEYVDGATLLEVTQERGPLELREASEIASQLLAGLQAVHDTGLVHRDVKPENIMLTRTGRVVLMDLGLAKQASDTGTGSVSGTPAYMAPEQARGDAVDGRADVYAAGVVLAEMVNPGGVKEHSSRQYVWEGVRSQPPRLPETPWGQVLRTAVAKKPAERFASANQLARALEQITLRVDRAEELQPYPGLASFGEDDAEYFFGREAEVEALWRRLSEPRLLAVVGPSGGGKSSFLRAGVVPARPEGWGHVLCTPGDAPFLSLGQALVSELSGDTDAIRQLLRFEDADVAVNVISGWRRRHGDALLIIDQFEELFTLNGDVVQQSFAELLARLAVEADVHVLLSMRDDFLMHCNRFESLRPLFSELTPLDPPRGDDMRRALVQPAVKCGYHFEHDGLVEQMLAEVEGERGALPLLAFAASQLWQRRDRDEGHLTRAAYEEIGGVGGALAQHAEGTLGRIGQERLEVVREIFRNLITVEGTRAIRDVDDLLTVFAEADRESAREVLRELVDARLLTTFDAPTEEPGVTGGQRIEVIHESLLSAWPRLVRWQTQDADGAQLRDQLRQAAQLWADRGEPEDLLWSGTAYRDLALWRERYTGGLTAAEEGFAEAARRRVGRQRRRRRLAVAALVSAAAVVSIVTSVLWQKSETAREEAVTAAQRAEASKLLALGQVAIDKDSSTAVAYALRSLELADLGEARLFALEALQRGPTTLTHGLGELAGQVQAIFTLAFSPDGRWIASGDAAGNVVLWPDDGGEPILFDSHESPDFVWNDVAFGTRGKRLVSLQDTMRIWSVPEGRMLREQELPPMTSGLVRGDRFFSFTTEGSEEVLRSWPLDGEEPRLVGRVPWANVFPPWNIDASGSWLAFAEGHTLRVRSLNDWTVRPRLVGRHEADVQLLEFHPDGDRLASVDESGEIRLWSLEAEGEEPLRILLGDAGPQGLEISPDGSWLAVTVHPPGSKTSIQLWDMNAPVDADPTRLPHQSYASLAFHPSGRWLVTTNTSSLNLHPLTRRYARVLRGHQGIVMGLGVAPDGNWLASTSHDFGDRPYGWARIWSLEAGGRSREVVAGIQTLAHSIDFDSAGQHLLLPASRTGAQLALPASRTGAQLARVDGGPPRALEGAPPGIAAVALSPDGRLAAAAPFMGPAGEKVMHVWDLPSGEHRTLGPLPGAGGGFAGGVWDLEFSHDGQLFSIGDGVGGITRWNVEQGTVEVLRRGSWGSFGEIALSADGRRLFSRTGTGFENDATMVGNLEVLDLESGKVQSLDSHGQRILGLALGARGEILATGDTEGTLRVGPVSGETPHVFFGHDGLIDEVAVDPHGRWVASAGADSTIRVWPMPQGPPFHTLPYEELLDRLRAVTNLRVVPDEESASGYRTEIGPFPGWREVPEW